MATKKIIQRDGNIQVKEVYTIRIPDSDIRDKIFESLR
jgi:hypothetical protein